MDVDANKEFGTIHSELAEHQGDEGICAEVGDAEFAITSSSQNGISIRITSSTVALFNPASTIDFTFTDENTLYASNEFTNEGYVFISEYEIRKQ